MVIMKVGFGSIVKIDLLLFLLKLYVMFLVEKLINCNFNLILLLLKLRFVCDLFFMKIIRLN